jgi:hypothetical protein
MRRAWLVLSTAVVASAQFAPGDMKPWEEADRQVLRLPPNAFTQLPANIVADLNRRGCTIPQVPGDVGLETPDRQNVIKGEFAKAGQTDWAVLCSVNRVSSILIFWNGSVESVSEIEKRPDIDHLQGWDGGRVIYSRHIAPATADFIAGHYEAYGGPKPPPLDHLGVDDQFVGKASIVQYFYNGKWLELTGAD